MMMKKLQLIFSKLFPLCLVLCGLNVAAVQAQSDITIDFGDEISGEPGDQVTITVNTSDLTGLDVPNFDFEFSFDSNLIQFNNEDITAGELLSANLVPNVTDDNRILVGYANSAPIAGSGTLLTLTGTLVSEGQNSEGFSVTDYFFGDGSLSVSPALPHHVPVNVEVVDTETIELDFGGKINAGPGESISVPVSTSDLTGLEISNFDFEFQFDSGLLSFKTEDILPGPLVSSISGNVTSDDRILVSYANSVPIEGEGLLFTINGTAESAGQNGNGFVVNDVLMGDGSADIFPTIPHSITVEVIANQPPTVTIVNGPADDSTIDFSDLGFAWSGSDTDGTVEGYEVDLQGPSPTGFSTTETTHQFTGLANGEYTFRVRAIDNDGASSSWKERSFTVNVSNPVIAVVPAKRTVSADAGTTTFEISNDGSGTLEWSASSTASWLSLEGATAGTGPATLQLTYSENTDSNSRTGTVEVTSSNASNSPVEVEVIQSGRTISSTYSEGWNLVSIPEEISSQSLEDYFSSISNDEVFEFAGQYIGFDKTEAIATGKGYWLKLNGNEEIEFTGQIPKSLTLDLEAGWNLVGTVGETLSVPGDIQDPNGIIENGAVWALVHDGTGSYELVEANEMLPGKGYFIKATAAGNVTLSNQ